MTAFRIAVIVVDLITLLIFLPMTCKVKSDGGLLVTWWIIFLLLGNIILLAQH